MNKKLKYLLVSIGLLASIQAKSQHLFKQLGAELSVWNTNATFTEKSESSSNKAAIVLFSLEGVSHLSKNFNVITRVGYASKQQTFNTEPPTVSKLEITHQLIPIHLGLEYRQPLISTGEKNQLDQGTFLIAEAGIDRYFELNHILQYNIDGTTLEDDFRIGGNNYGYSGAISLEKRFPLVSLGLTVRYRASLSEMEYHAEPNNLKRNSSSGLDFGLRLRVMLRKPQSNSAKQ